MTAYRLLLLIILGSSAVGCALKRSDVQDTPNIIYLHGQIMEGATGTPVSPKYGPYQYAQILSELSKPKQVVISEVRPAGTKGAEYADKVVEQVRKLQRQGVPAHRITIVGASAGAVIAMLAATRLADPAINYVLMGNCNDWVVRTFNPKLSGRILSIYDAADDIGGSCATMVAASSLVSEFQEVRLETGLGHGFLYRPLPGWVEPARAWVRSARPGSRKAKTRG